MLHTHFLYKRARNYGFRENAIFTMVYIVGYKARNNQISRCYCFTYNENFIIQLYHRETEKAIRYITISH
jgi:hypothetical protein